MPVKHLILHEGENTRCFCLLAAHGAEAKTAAEITCDACKRRLANIPVVEGTALHLCKQLQERQGDPALLRATLAILLDEGRGACVRDVLLADMEAKTEALALMGFPTKVTSRTAGPFEGLFQWVCAPVKPRGLGEFLHLTELLRRGEAVPPEWQMQNDEFCSLTAEQRLAQVRKFYVEAI